MPIIVALGGIPAVGKTTIVKQFFYKYKNWKSFKYKKLYGHYSGELNLIILGKYIENELFSGTDKLSMAVQPDFEEFIDKEKPPYNILFEGDRLFNIKTLQKVKDKMTLQVYIVTSNNTDQRHIDRNDSQSEKFIKGRLTKVENIRNFLKEDYITLTNNEEQDIGKNFEIIMNNYNNFRGI
tara:strand:+ start:1283 stop:1825 length:543 start_codon:yes stop_codon:yes gene_type:complete